jgi:L-rhamnose isomerase
MDHNEAAQLAGEIVKAESREAVDKYAGGVDKIVKELALIGFSDPSQFVDIAEGGELRFRTFKEMGKKRRCLKKISEKTVITESKDGEKVYKTSTVDYELWSKPDALRELIVLGGYRPAEKKDVKHEGTVTVEVVNYAEKVDNPVDK